MSNKVIIEVSEPNKVTVTSATTITVTQVSSNDRVVYV